MSSRVTVNGKSYHRDPGAPMRPFHKPIIGADPSRADGTMTRCHECQAWCFAVNGPSGWYWRHEPDTFWTSR